MAGRVGDGTGEGGSVPTRQGQSANEGKEPNATSGTGQGEAGTGPKVVTEGNRNTPQSGHRRDSSR